MPSWPIRSMSDVDDDEYDFDVKELKIVYSSYLSCIFGRNYATFTVFAEN